MSRDLSLAVTRRQFIQATTVVAAGAAFSIGRSAHAAPTIKILETKVISHQPQYYCGWPTVARRRNGDLLVSWSGGREGHVCPFGRVELMVSHDNGATWCWPQVLLDGPIDDRDSGVLETAKGSILVTTFTSLAYESMLLNAEKKKPGDKGAWPEEKLKAWQTAHNRLSAEQRQAELGQWMVRSTDGGVTWSARYPTIVNSPHGPIQLSDGRLLYAGKELWTGEKRMGVCESLDDGQTWHWLATIPVRDGDAVEKGYHELHAVETTDGRVIVQIRNHNKANSGETLQTESSDGGKTWSVPHSIGVWGLPSHLLRLRSGKLLMTYGHRRPPFGNQARVSDDGGKTWSEPVIVSGDGPGGDLGYPSTVELADGTLLSVWYELMKGSPRAVLRQTHWKLEI
ncbi:MAG: sialidase family protein [Verrucomicrobia bacterium]|nr:sialidase family protein [Verrucomicrobiota bacterium]